MAQNRLDVKRFLCQKIGFLQNSQPSVSSIARKAVSSTTGTPSSLALASLEPGFSPQRTNEVFFDTLPAALPPCARTRASGFAAAQGRQRAGDDDRLAGQRAAGRAPLGLGQPHARRVEPSEQPRRRFACEKGRHGPRGLGSDLVDGAELLLGRLRKRVQRAEGRRQQLGGSFRRCGGCRARRGISTAAPTWSARATPAGWTRSFRRSPRAARCRSA